MGRKLSLASGSRTALLKRVRFFYHFCFLITARPVSRLDSSNIVQALIYRGFKQFSSRFLLQTCKSKIFRWPKWNFRKSEEWWSWWNNWNFEVSARIFKFETAVSRREFFRNHPNFSTECTFLRSSRSKKQKIKISPQTCSQKKSQFKTSLTIE